MRTTVSAMINALQNGNDYSNGAIAWDGAEQGMMTGENCSDNGYQSHAAGIGWTIHSVHYKNWSDNINNKWADKFIAPQHVKAIKCNAFKNKNGVYFNEGLYRYESVAQYALTIFWKDRGISENAKYTVND